MADMSFPTPTAEQRRVAASQYERANEVIATGDYDYAIDLLKKCCALDPANMIYRKGLRGTQKIKHGDNLRGSRFASVTTAGIKLRLKKALMGGHFLKVLEIAEEVLSHNPWDISTQMAMADAFDHLSAPDAAVWTLEQARQKDAKDLKLNRKLARLYEKTGQFTHANVLWEVIRKADPRDEEAQRKVKDLAASETISRGNYEAVLYAPRPDGEMSDDDDSLPEGSSPLAGGPVVKDRSSREIEALQEKIEDEPHNHHHYVQLAQIYRRREQWDKARETIEAGLNTAGNQFELTIELAEADVQPFRANLHTVERKLRKHADDDKLQRLRHKLTKEINTRELDIYRQKADRYPTDMSFRLEMGIRLLQLGQVEEAIAELQMVRADPRWMWKALTFLGFCFKGRHNWRLAQRNFEDALRHLPPTETMRRKEILYQLAKGCAGAGDVNAAIEWGYELANEDFAYKGIGKLLDEWQGRN